MAGLWDGLPASPVSGASDDPSTKHAAQAAHFSKPKYATSPVSDSLLALPKRPLSPNICAMSSPPPLKRSRSDRTTTSMDVDRRAASTSGSIEFVEAKDGKADSSSDLVARLNFSATDERRKALLQRLRDIDARKAQLAKAKADAKASKASTRPRSAQSSNDDEVVIVEEKSTRPPTTVASPTDIQDVVDVPAAPRRTRKRTARASATKKPARGKRPAPAAVTVIDVDAEPSVAEVKPRAGKAKKAPAGKSINPSLPKRTSSRVRRPRTHTLQPAESGHIKAAPTPTCMSKCKRFQFCKKLISSLLRNSSAGPFSAPVKQLWALEAIPRYFDVITHPMDLGTIKKNLETSVYISPAKNTALPYAFEVEKFADDVRLVFRNAMVYNRAGDMLYNCAKLFMEDFEKTMIEQLPPAPTPEEVAQTLAKKKSGGRRVRKEKPPVPDVYKSLGIEVPGDTIIPNKGTGNHDGATKVSEVDQVLATIPAKKTKVVVTDDVDVTTDTVEEMEERLQYLRRCRPVVLSRTPVPKGSGYLSRAALLYDITMHFDQKVKCSSAIENGKVPASKIESLVELVRKSTPAEQAGSADEFVFEFDKLDNKAWRNIEAFLEAFVPGFKTIRSSCLGREFSSVQEVDEEVKSLEEKLADQGGESTEGSVRVTEKPRSFFGGNEDDGESSSDSSDDESDSDSSDSDSDLD